jgi:hypothetical protein
MTRTAAYRQNLKALLVCSRLQPASVGYSLGRGGGEPNHAHHLARLGMKVLFVQPSIFLINKTLNDLASLTPEVRFRAIHGETSNRVIDHRSQSPLMLLS